MKPVKIFELSGDKWRDGMSLQTASAVGGIFSSTTNFDPFEITGMMQCSLASATGADSSITSTPTTIQSFQKSGVGYLYAHTPTKLYEVLDGSPYTTVDKTANISVASSVRGSIIFNGYYVYSLSNTVRARIVPVTSGSDVQILALSTDGTWHPMCVGADKNLYIADYAVIGKITNSLAAGNGVLGTTNNVGTAVSLENGMYARALVNDGRYLVILADNNPSGDYNNTGGTTPPVPVTGNYRCQVLYWDMVKSSFDQIYEFTDSNIIGGAFLDGGIYVFTGNGIYVTNISTAPKQIFSFRTGSSITEKPTTPFQITTDKNSIYWCGQSNGSIYAYGSLYPGMKKVFYQPFNSSYTPSAIISTGTNFYIGTSGSNNMLRVTGTGSTRNTGSISTAPLSLPQDYKFDFIKVTMQQPLASGDTIDAYMNTQNGNAVITNTNVKNFSTIGAKQTILFDRKYAGSGLDVETFNDFSLVVSSAKAIKSVEVWATPQENYSQQT